MSGKPKIVIGETASPSAELVRQALKDETVRDERGRSLTLRKPGVLAQYRIVEAVGPEAAANQTYMQMVNPLIYLAEIDGEAVYFPQSKAEVEALIQRLDDDGLAAVFSWYMTNIIGPTQSAIAAAQRAAEDKAKLKNS